MDLGIYITVARGFGKERIRAVCRHEFLILYSFGGAGLIGGSKAFAPWTFNLRM